MTAEQFMRIRTRLKCVWSDLFTTQEAFNVWFDSFRNYDFGLIEQATINYINKNRFKPTPADILMEIRTVRADINKQYEKFVPRFERIPDEKADGGYREVQVFKCQRCKDTGLIIWEDKEQRCVGRPCTCEAALANYSAARKALESQYDEIAKRRDRDEI